MTKVKVLAAGGMLRTGLGLDAIQETFTLSQGPDTQPARTTLGQRVTPRAEGETGAIANDLHAIAIETGCGADGTGCV